MSLLSVEPWTLLRDCRHNKMSSSVVGPTKRSSVSISEAETCFRNNVTVSEDCVNRENDNKTDPGACRHGNFINYYQFHPAKERLLQLPTDVWHADSTDRKYVGLDVGCNAGVSVSCVRRHPGSFGTSVSLFWSITLLAPSVVFETKNCFTDRVIFFFLQNLTIGLYDFLKKRLDADVSLLGVDLDPILIQRAREGVDDAIGVTYDCVDFMSDESGGIIKNYLNSKDRLFFDVVFCFSITMWIHLNHGDEGLVKFLKTICEWTKLIVVEPQPWKCYRNALRRLRRANVSDLPTIDNLEYKGDVELHIEQILASDEHCGFEKVTESTNYNDWGRKLLLYRRKPSD